MTGRVLLLSPSRGLGGEIERYVQTLESAFTAAGVACQRPGLSVCGVRAHARRLAPRPRHPAVSLGTRPPGVACARRGPAVRA
jgi:hypothetical protein